MWLSTRRLSASRSAPRSRGSRSRCWRTASFNVFEAAANAGVRKLVAASSASVYGLADDFPTPEEHHPYNNRTLYGAAKAFNEGLLRSFHEMYGLNYVALRYFNVYGPRMDIHGTYTEVLIRWMERIAAGKPCLILGDGGQTMDFVYVEDVARANVLAAKSDVTDERLQCRQRERDEPAGPGGRAAQGDGLGAAARVRAGEESERGDAPTRRYPCGRAGARVPGGGDARRGTEKARELVERAEG